MLRHREDYCVPVASVKKFYFDIRQLEKKKEDGNCQIDVACAVRKRRVLITYSQVAK
jgi:hypothetical protein